MRPRFYFEGEDITEKLAETGRRMRLLGMMNSMQSRFDRCCHPGKPGDGVLFFRRLRRENSQ